MALRARAARSSPRELCHPGDRLVTATCTHESTTGPVTLGTGDTLCLRPGALITGPVTIKAGGTLTLDGVRITGPVTVSAGASVQICNSQISGPLSVTG